MRRSFIIAATLVPVLGTAVAFAAERTFQRPLYQNGQRIDACYAVKGCETQMAADAYCRVQGYTKATKFTKEKARPTVLIGQKRTCDANFCEAFKTITCTVAGEPGGRRDWPTRID